MPTPDTLNFGATVKLYAQLTLKIALYYQEVGPFPHHPTLDSGTLPLQYSHTHKEIHLTIAKFY